MLPTQQTIQFSNYSALYDLIVPKIFCAGLMTLWTSLSFKKNLWINTAMTMAVWLKVL